MKRIIIPTSKNKTQYFSNQTYVKYVAAVKGLEPVLVTPESDLERAVAECSGLLLTGGIDVDPIYYDMDNDGSFTTDPEKDAFERDIFNKVRGMNKPIFAICRGLQLVALEFLNTHIEFSDFFTFIFHVNNHQAVQELDIARTTPSHSVQIIPRALYRDQDKGMRKIFVNSMHHQCLLGLLDTEENKIITRVSSTTDQALVRVGAWTQRGLGKIEEGYIVESFRITGWGGEVLAVQWHPEELMDTKLLEAIFIENKKAIPKMTKVKQTKSA
jgi:gamma-glutamyl-gamma-aminobutyrate hydrolase PuuD